jgi:protein-disulfide isomerase
MSVEDRLAYGGVGSAVGGLPRRYLLIAGGTMAATGIAIGGAVLSSNADGRSEDKTPGTEYAYPLLGGADASATVTYFGNYKCPYCARFSSGLLTELREKYVEPGDLAIRYRHLSYINGRPFLGPDAVTAGHADLAVYNNDAESYWDFHQYIYANQGPESRRWADTETLV